MWGQRIIAARPQTYMNASGEAVLSLLTAFRLKPADILVIFDDADLPYGRLRFRREGGSGGHHGLDSIIGAVGAGFNRLRIGIARPEADQSGLRRHVLSRFSKAERAQLPEILDRAVRGVETFVQEGVQSAMNKFNLNPCSKSGPKIQRP